MNKKNKQKNKQNKMNKKKLIRKIEQKNEQKKVYSSDPFWTLTGPAASPVKRGVCPGAIPSSPKVPVANTIVASPE